MSKKKTRKMSMPMRDSAQPSAYPWSSNENVFDCARISPSEIFLTDCSLRSRSRVRCINRWNLASLWMLSIMQVRLSAKHCIDTDLWIKLARPIACSSLTSRDDFSLKIDEASVHSRWKREKSEPSTNLSHLVLQSAMPARVEKCCKILNVSASS